MLRKRLTLHRTARRIDVTCAAGEQSGRSALSAPPPARRYGELMACRQALDDGCSGRLCRVRGAGTASLPRKPSSNASQNKGWREEAILGKVPTKSDAFRQAGHQNIDAIGH